MSKKKREQNIRSDEFDENKNKMRKNNHIPDSVRWCLEHCQLLISHTTTCEHIETDIYFISIFLPLFLPETYYIASNAWLLCRMLSHHGWYTIYNYCGFVFCYVFCVFHNWEYMQLKLISVFIRSVNRTVDERDTRQCKKVLMTIIIIIIFKKFFSFEFRSQ